MTMRSRIIAAYTIKKEGLFNLKIAGRLPDYANNLRMGVVRTEPILRGILDKGIETIAPQERGRIAYRHVSINVQTGTDKGLVLKLSLAFALVAGLVLAWNYKLKKYNAELERLSQTDLLTDLPNRRQVMARLGMELERVRRYGHPFSLIILDIDHFKCINDQLGHLGVDRFLIAFAGILRETVRVCDLAGRIGSEEFLVLCPETTREQARRVAERIRVAVAGHAFETGRRHSVSAGVAAYTPGERGDDLQGRADSALYRCKQDGRNRVCLR